MESAESSVEGWLGFFMGAGIPSRVAADYAVTFSDNRMRLDMLPDLNKDYLRDMDIITMGDVIAILKHAKAVSQQEYTARKIAGGSAAIQLSSASAAPRAAIRPLPGATARPAAAAAPARGDRTPPTRPVATAIFQEPLPATTRLKRSGDVIDEGRRPVQPAMKRRPAPPGRPAPPRPVTSTRSEYDEQRYEAEEAAPPPPPARARPRPDPAPPARARPDPAPPARARPDPAPPVRARPDPAPPAATAEPAAARPRPPPAPAPANTRFTITGLGPAPPTERQPFGEQPETAATAVRGLPNPLGGQRDRSRSPRGPVQRRPAGDPSSQESHAVSGAARRRVVPPPASSAPLDLQHLDLDEDLQTVSMRQEWMRVQFNRGVDRQRAAGADEREVGAEVVRMVHQSATDRAFRSDRTARARLVGQTRQRAAPSPIRFTGSPTRAAPSPVRFASSPGSGDGGPAGVPSRLKPAPADTGMRSRLKPVPAVVSVRDRLKPAPGAGAVASIRVKSGTGEARVQPRLRGGPSESRLKPAPAEREVGSRLKPAPAETRPGVQTGSGVRSRLGASVRVTTGAGKVVRLKSSSVYSRLGHDR